MMSTPFGRRELLCVLSLLPLLKAGCSAARGVGVPASQFGMQPGASGEANEQAMRRAIEAARSQGGLELLFDPGVYRFAVRYPWILPAGMRFVGAGKAQTLLQRVDANPCSWIVARNSVGRYGFRGFTALGNGHASNSGDGAFFDAQLDSHAQEAMQDFAFDAIELRNFGGDGWIRFVIEGAAAHDIRNIRIAESCSFRSSSGNSRGPRDLGIWSSAIVFRGSLDTQGAGGRIRDAFVGPVAADIPHIKSLCVIWGGVVGARVERPVIERCGTIGIAGNCGAYAIAIGNETRGAPNPDRIEIIAPVIKACLSVGVYSACWGGKGGAISFDGAGGYIANVTDKENGSLPKGAIAATDGATTLTIRNLRAINCIAAIDAPLATGAVLLVDGVDAQKVPANGVGVRVAMQEGFTNTGPARQITLRNIRVQSDAPGVAGIKFDTRYPLGPVRIEGVLDIDVPYIGVSAYDEARERGAAPFSTFEWSGRATIRNARAGAIAFRNNLSPLVVSAEIVIERGDVPGNREPRIKAGGARNLKISGRMRIEGADDRDDPPWEGLSGRACRPEGKAARGSQSVTTDILAKC